MKNYLLQFVSGNDWDFSTIRNYIENHRSLKDFYQQTDKKDFFENKTAIVTGASSGIGKAIAIELAKRGANVVLASRDESKLQGVTGQINDSGGIAVGFSTDVSDQKQCKALIDKSVNSFGRIDILVNNAGISMRANFHDVDLSVLKRVMDTNFWGTVYCTKHALPYILAQKGSVVGISSICGITPLPGRTGYSASKHAMDGFLESLRVENLARGLHVMLVHPGFTSSNIRNVALNRYGKPQVETPLDENSLMSAEGVAKAVLEGIELRKRDIILTREGKLITWIYRRMPEMAEKLIHREMRREVGAPFA